MTPNNSVSVVVLLKILDDSQAKIVKLFALLEGNVFELEVVHVLVSFFGFHVFELHKLTAKELNKFIDDNVFQF